ncbi:MAG TPA: hypothetical protein VLA37_03835 [Sphingomonadaceae bacterium]|nr:hypothetical protein [Sphingomonadaceae bacterium]
MSRDPHLHFEFSFEEEPEVKKRSERRKRKSPPKRDPENEPGLLWKRFREEE